MVHWLLLRILTKIVLKKFILQHWNNHLLFAEPLPFHAYSDLCPHNVTKKYRTMGACDTLIDLFNKN
jgi:hypothetical protein